MAEKKTRRELLIAAAAAAAGGAAGYGGARLWPAPTLPPPPGPAALSQTPTFRLTIQGGYGWLFRTNNGKTTATVMSLKSASCSDSSLFVDHHMLLIVPELQTIVDGSTTYPATNDGKHRLFWVLNGPTTFISGLPGSGLGTQPPMTPVGSLADPFGPLAPSDDTQWDDKVWLPGPATAKPNPESLASRSIVLTDGDLSVHKPTNEQAQRGRWVFKDKTTGNETRRALTDVLRLSGTFNGMLGLQTQDTTGATKQIVLKPKSHHLFLDIRHQLDLDPTVLEEGKPLPHFAMLYDFVKDSSCDQGIVPTFEKRSGLTGAATPGDLCPPMMLQE